MSRQGRGGVHGGWRPPRHCTVIGAAHRRRGQPCQDASLSSSLRCPGGGSLQVLAVADGHGGRRYSRSDVGSRLACEEALAAVTAALHATPLPDQTAWLEQLRHGLPRAIEQGWREAVARHWRQAPEGEEQGCTRLYGTTLGLLLLAPDWWGCTGLGDWDLVRVNCGSSREDAALLSEESLAAAAGEATASLCLEEAAALCLSRARLEPIAPGTGSFTLLLSTDGVRKSCATDGDFLELCGQIAALPTGEQLGEGLAAITAQGSGDDLSIALGQWVLPPEWAVPPGLTAPPAVGRASATLSPRAAKAAGTAATLSMPALALALTVLALAILGALAVATWLRPQLSQRASDRAAASVQTLVQALSRADRPSLEARLTPAAAAQWTPQAFGPFARLEVSGLRPVARSGHRVELQGVLTVVGVDGSRRSEVRRFMVDTAPTPPRIIASNLAPPLGPGQ